MRSDHHNLPTDPIDAAVEALLDPAFDLDGETTPILITIINRARAAGRVFEPMTLALVAVLRRQLAGDDADLERCVDDGLEDDRADEEDGQDDPIQVTDEGAVFVYWSQESLLTSRRCFKLHKAVGQRVGANLGGNGAYPSSPFSGPNAGKARAS